MRISEKDTKYVWHPFDVYKLPHNLLIKKGTGAWLHTHDGRKIFDGISSWWVNLHGHRNRHINKAVAKQLRYLEHVIFAGFTHAPAINLAESLIKILPGGMEKIFFSDNGSTATEVALKLAVQYWHNHNIIEKKKIIALQGAYHGDTFGAMAVAERGGFNVPFEPYLFEVEFLPLPSAQSVEVFENTCKKGDVAAFIYEPLVQGSAGMRMHSPLFLDTYLAIAQKYNVITIADEVFTGFGRTGKLFASEYCSHTPDIICLSKGLTGGYLPMGATAVNSKILAAFKSKSIELTFLHGHSYTGNPLACAAANESLRLLLSRECVQQRAMIEDTFKKWAQDFQNHPKLNHARSIGCLFAFEVKNPNDTTYFNPVREWLYAKFLEKNVLLRPLGNTVYVLPPYCATAKDLNTVKNVILNVLDEYEA